MEKLYISCGKMFSWSFPKSAEAMFSRWAVKRVCKFLLKKKLGKFILGDIDLNQLDVQLGAGIIQLSDLALNVDYLNEKFSTAAVLLKEGSVGSLMITMPWKDGGCRIEVDELEVILAPRRVKISHDDSETCCHSQNGNNNSSHGFRKPDNGTHDSGAANAFVDVHEGVKTIAKMVKWLLTSFHVKIKKLIMAFDPVLEGDNYKGFDRVLVLRISEAECGTHISEDLSSSSSTTAHNFLGLSRLTNFVEFKGAVLELVHVHGLDHQSVPQSSSEATFSNWFSGHCSTNNMTSIIIGDKGGFSGSLKLSLPWKNGSLDIRKVDADLHIEPLELRLEPDTIRSFIFMWDIFKGIRDESEELGHQKPSESLLAPRSSTHPSVNGLLSNDGFVADCLMEKEPVHTLLSESHLISDWVSKSQEDRTEDTDFGASVDQFFECFDGLRNSQSALGNSGMWNWTCSVFSAITAASNLASGSLHVPSEQQHVETNFNATIKKVSLLLSLIDEDQPSPTMNSNKADTDTHIHFVCAQFVALSLALQVHPREMNFEVVVQHIQLVDHLCSLNDLMDHKMHGRNGNSVSEIASIQKMQDGVQGALLTFQETKKDPEMGHQLDYSVDISLSTKNINGCCHVINGKGICWKDSSVTLLKTSGVSRCHVKIRSGSSGGSSMGPTSFSLKLPPFVCWVNFDLITMILEFLKEIANCIGKTHIGNGFVPESDTKGYEFVDVNDQRKFSSSRSSSLSAKKFLEGNIFLPNARIILSFPPRGHKGFSSYSSCDHFIAIDIVSPTIGGKGVRSSKPSLDSFVKRLNMTASVSLNINIGDFYLFSVSSKFTENFDGSGMFNTKEATFSALKIISAVNRTGHLSHVRMFWQEGPVTGPWIAKKAKLLASSEYGKSEDKVVGKGSEFASVKTVSDIKDFETPTRQEMLATSSFFIYGQLPPVTVTLDKSQYENICCLLNQVVEHFSGVISESDINREEHSAMQTSIVLECESVTLSISIEPISDVKCSMHSELPGSWIRLTLQIDKFELLTVSNIGGISSANFLWVTHRQGSLWGSITEGLYREFLLISCNDSIMGRGDGQGSNVLSSRCSGSDIINFWDPESKHSFTSINIRCATLFATGGRMDWFNTILTFFAPPSSGFDQTHDDNIKKACGSSFILNLVDVGLSYEPYIEKLMANLGSGLKSSDLNTKVSKEELNVACLLAASSLRLSNTTVTECAEVEHKIRLQDLGLLICSVPETGLVNCTYSVEHLSKTGYVKVAHEANVEALFRTNCDNGHAWELECTESHVMLNMCHDTTFGLIRLATQLQSLFAPDIQDYVVHLENRWNNVQQVHEISDEMSVGSGFSPSSSHSETSSNNKKSKIGNLMDEICEDVFQLDGNSDGQAKTFESYLFTSGTDLVASEASSSEEKNPDLIEEYFLSDLRPLSGLALKSQSSDIRSCKTGAVRELGNSGWYGGTPLKILENHASEVEQTLHKSVEFDTSTSDSEHVEVGKAVGCVLLKNMNVSWRMYSGSDWSNSQNTSQTPVMTCPRDSTTYLELVLSGIGCEYDVYPEGDTCSSRLSLSIQDFSLYDRSDDAPWKLVLGNYQSKKYPRKFSSQAVKLNLEAVKPDPSIRIEENRLQITLLPLLLHLHQRQLDFLISFFGGKNSSGDSNYSTLDLSESGEPFEMRENLQARAIDEAFLTYFQKFDMRPMLVRVDYTPCRFDLKALSGGKYVELVNLVPWKGVELQLKHVHGVGLYGWSSVFETIIGEWLEDVSQNQVHKLLKGLPPIKSLVAVSSGAAKLVSLPVKNYKKDHRLLKGMQRGTFAFLRSISLEAIGLGVHLAGGAHNILLQAEYILACIPPSVPWPVESRVGNSVRSNQPNDAQQGIQQACQSISDGLGKSASALVQTPLKRYQRGAGMGSALATAAQSAPAAAIAPASAAARAVHCALLGFRNSLDPEHKKESVEKYLGRSPPHEPMQ